MFSYIKENQMPAYKFTKEETELYHKAIGFIECSQDEREMSALKLWQSMSRNKDYAQEVDTVIEHCTFNLDMVRLAFRTSQFKGHYFSKKIKDKVYIFNGEELFEMQLATGKICTFHFDQDLLNFCEQFNNRYELIKAKNLASFYYSTRYGFDLYKFERFLRMGRIITVDAQEEEEITTTKECEECEDWEEFDYEED